MTKEDMQKAHEVEIGKLVDRLARNDTESNWALVRALVHQAVHLAAERRAGEFCNVATLFGEMIGHSHDIMHAGNTGHVQTH